MKAAKFNLKKSFFIIAGILFLALTSCTKDDLDPQDSISNERVDLMPENNEDDLRPYQ